MFLQRPDFCLLLDVEETRLGLFNSSFCISLTNNNAILHTWLTK